MDFKSLSANEKLAVYGSLAVIVGGIVGAGIGGLGLLAVLAAAGMLAVVFLPQFSPGTALPGSKGSLMLILGAVAAAVMLLAFLSILSLLGAYFQVLALNALFFLVAVAGALVMGWAGWQAFQAEGGKFVLGTPGGGSSSTPPASRTDTAAPRDVGTRDANDDRPATPPA